MWSIRGDLLTGNNVFLDSLHKEDITAYSLLISAH